MVTPALFVLACCSNGASRGADAPAGERAAADVDPGADLERGRDVSEGGLANARLADVVSVQVDGASRDYRLRVTVRSPDTGCERYADWWEVVGEDGELLYRRILAHSHVGEQPFTRSGGPVEVEDGTTIWVRAHMSDTGYGGQLMTGALPGPFEIAAPPLGFAASLETSPPLPKGCAF